MPSYPLRHQKSARARSYRLRVEPSGEVVVSTPLRFDKHQLTKFLADHHQWIETQRQKILTIKANLETDSTIRLFGELYQKQIIIEPLEPSQVKIEAQTLSLQTPGGTPDELKKLMERFLKQTAEQYLLPRTKRLAEIMNISYRSLKIGQQKSQWGSCNRRGDLSFNWRLVHAPREVIDYVIIHELSHRTHMNHSRAFWNLVAEYDPDYQLHRGWLKRFGLSAC